VVKDVQALGVGQSIFFHLALTSSTQYEPATIYAMLWATREEHLLNSAASLRTRFSVVTISGQPLGVMEARLVKNRCKSCLCINDRNLSNDQKELKMFSL